jgi:hypothetical protein
MAKCRALLGPGGRLVAVAGAHGLRLRNGDPGHALSTSSFTGIPPGHARRTSSSIDLQSVWSIAPRIRHRLRPKWS